MKLAHWIILAVAWLVGCTVFHLALPDCDSNAFSGLCTGVGMIVYAVFSKDGGPMWGVGGIVVLAFTIGLML